MELQDVTEIREITGQSGVNAYLKAGWIILNTFTKTNDDPRDQFLMYSLGWPKGTPAVHP